MFRFAKGTMRCCREKGPGVSVPLCIHSRKTETKKGPCASCVIVSRFFTAPRKATCASHRGSAPRVGRRKLECRTICLCDGVAGRRQGRTRGWERTTTWQALRKSPLALDCPKRSREGSVLAIAIPAGLVWERSRIPECADVVRVERHQRDSDSHTQLWSSQNAGSTAGRVGGENCHWKMPSRPSKRRDGGMTAGGTAFCAAGHQGRGGHRKFMYTSTQGSQAMTR